MTGDYLVMMTCANDHQWAEVGQRADAHSISLGTCSAEGAADDPTCCKTCGQPAGRISVLGPPKARRRRHTCAHGLRSDAQCPLCEAERDYERERMA